MGAAMQNGVGGHAGLFGTAVCGSMLVMQMYLQARETLMECKFIDPEAIRGFQLRVSYCDQGNRRGIGFDKPQLGRRT